MNARHIVLFSVCLGLMAVAFGTGCSDKGEQGTAATRSVEGEESSRFMKATFSVPSLHCSSCDLKVKTALEQIPGVEKAYSNYLQKIAWAKYDSLMVTPDRMVRAIRGLGLKDARLEGVEPYKPAPLPDME